jgi:hypothetical protein
MIGRSRVFALGYFVPVNSKKAEAGTKQRWLSPSAGFPSEN